MTDSIRAALIPALEAVLTYHPDYVIFSIPAETFWVGHAGSNRLHKKLERITKCGVAEESDTC